jgi:hypothetical protein
MVIDLLCDGIIDRSSIDDMQQSALCTKLAIALLEVLARLPVLGRFEVMRELACVAGIAAAERIEFYGQSAPATSGKYCRGHVWCLSAHG